MSLDVKIPPAGESIATATIAHWNHASGQQVYRGQVLVTIETDKVSTEIESEADGVLEILVSEGQEVEIGAIIARIHASENAPSQQPAAENALGQPMPEKAAAQMDPIEEAKALRQMVAPTPAPNHAAAPVEKPRAVLTKTPAPVETMPAASENANSRTTRRKMSPLRRKISQQLVNSQNTAAILTTFNECNMLPVSQLRKELQTEFQARHGVKLGFMSFFIKATVQALKTVPQLNAQISGTDIVENHYFDIGIAVGTEKGLIVPVIRDCDKKTFAQIEQELADYAQKARQGAIKIEDLQGGVFTITNGGIYGSLLSTPIINAPESGILGMHSIQDRPVAIDGKVEIQPMMYLALSYDHRLVDGKDAVTFLIAIKKAIENPTRLLLDA